MNARKSRSDSGRNGSPSSAVHERRSSIRFSGPRDAEASDLRGAGPHPRRNTRRGLPNSAKADARTNGAGNLVRPAPPAPEPIRSAHGVESAKARPPALPGDPRVPERGVRIRGVPRRSAPRATDSTRDCQARLRTVFPGARTIAHAHRSVARGPTVSDSAPRDSKNGGRPHAITRPCPDSDRGPRGGVAARTSRSGRPPRPYRPHPSKEGRSPRRATDPPAAARPHRGVGVGKPLPPFQPTRE